MNKNTKILIAINNLSYGGAERIVVDQINELIERGFNVSLVTIVPTFKKGFWENVNLPENKKISLNAPSFNLFSLWTCIKFLRQEKPDILITHLFLANSLMRLASLFMFKRPKIICYEHNIYSKEKKSRHLLVDKFLSVFTKRIIAVSLPVKEFLIENGISSKKISVIENGISYDFIKNLQTKEEKRRDLFLTHNDFVLVSVGNVNPQKGHDLLIEAANILRMKNKKIKILICGSDTSDFAVGLKQLVAEKKLDDSVLFLGTRSDVLDIVNCANIFCMPSLWEGLSIALLEAMGMGKAIIVSDISSMLTVIINEENGLLFPSGQFESLGVQIGRLMTDSQLLDNLGNKAKERSRDYSIKQNVDKLLEVVNE